MRLRTRTVFLYFSLAAVLSSGPLPAQDSGVRDRDRELNGRKRLLAELQRARVQYGPFYLLSRFELRNLGFDQGVEIPTREELDDLTVTVAAPQKLYLVANKKVIFSAEVEPAYVWFRDQKELRTWNSLYRGDAYLLLNRIFVDAYAGQSEETVRDLSELSELVNRNSRQAGVETEFKFSSKTEIRFRTILSDLDFSRISGSGALQINQLQRTENNQMFMFRHKTFRRTALSATAEVRSFDFDLADSRDGSLRAVYLGADRTGSGARFIEDPIQIRVGYGELDYDDPETTGYRGVLGDIQVSLSPHRHLLLAGKAERQLQFSIFERNHHYAADRLRLTASSTFFSDLEVVGNLEHGFNRYFTESPRIGERRLDEISFTSIGVKYRVARNSSVGVGVGYYRRDSNIGEFNEDGIRLFVQLSISP